MKPLSKMNTLDTVISILVVSFTVKLLWFVTGLILLPSSGIDHKDKATLKALYYPISLSEHTRVPVLHGMPQRKGTSIKDMKLLAVYSDKAHAIVTVMYKGKTSIVAKGESVMGFILTGAGRDYALFQKKGKSYQLMLYTPKDTGISAVSPQNTMSDMPKHEDTVSSNEEIIAAGDRRIIDRSLVTHYTQHIDEVYKDIGMRDMKEGNALTGFQVTFVRRGSPFAKLGLKRGDVLKSINGQALTSYSAAFNAYRNMNDMSNVTLTIQRGNTDMELHYEIN